MPSSPRATTSGGVQAPPRIRIQTSSTDSDLTFSPSIPGTPVRSPQVFNRTPPPSSAASPSSLPSTPPRTKTTGAQNNSSFAIPPYRGPHSPSSTDVNTSARPVVKVVLNSGLMERMRANLEKGQGSLSKGNLGESKVGSPGSKTNSNDKVAVLMDPEKRGGNVESPKLVPVPTGDELKYQTMSLFGPNPRSTPSTTPIHSPPKPVPSSPTKSPAKPSEIAHSSPTKSGSSAMSAGFHLHDRKGTSFTYNPTELSPVIEGGSERGTSISGSSYRLSNLNPAGLFSPQPQSTRNATFINPSRSSIRSNSIFTTSDVASGISESHSSPTSNQQQRNTSPTRKISPELSKRAAYFENAADSRENSLRSGRSGSGSPRKGLSEEGKKVYWTRLVAGGAVETPTPRSPADPTLWEGYLYSPPLAPDTVSASSSQNLVALPKPSTWIRRYSVLTSQALEYRPTDSNGLKGVIVALLIRDIARLEANPDHRFDIGGDRKDWQGIYPIRVGLQDGYSEWFAISSEEGRENLARALEQALEINLKDTITATNLFREPAAKLTRSPGKSIDKERYSASLDSRSNTPPKNLAGPFPLRSDSTQSALPIYDATESTSKLLFRSPKPAESDVSSPRSELSSLFGIGSRNRARILPVELADINREEDTVEDGRIAEQNFPDLFGHFRNSRKHSIPTSSNLPHHSPSKNLAHDTQRGIFRTSVMRTVKLPQPPVWNPNNADYSRSTADEKRAQRQAERQGSQILPTNDLSPPSNSSSLSTFEKSSELPVAIEEGLRKLLNTVLNRGQEEPLEAQATRMNIQSSLRGMSRKVKDMRSAGLQGSDKDASGSSDLQLKIDGLADVSNAILRPDLSSSEQTRMFDKVARLIQLLLDNSPLFNPALHRARATAMLPMNDYLPESADELQRSLYSSSPTKVMLEADQQTVTTRHAIHDEEQESEWRSDRERMADEARKSYDAVREHERTQTLDFEGASKRSTSSSTHVKNRADDPFFHNSIDNFERHSGYSQRTAMNSDLACSGKESSTSDRSELPSKLIPKRDTHLAAILSEIRLNSEWRGKSTEQSKTSSDFLAQLASYITEDRLAREAQWKELTSTIFELTQHVNELPTALLARLVQAEHEIEEEVPTTMDQEDEPIHNRNSEGRKNAIQADDDEALRQDPSMYRGFKLRTEDLDPLVQVQHRMSANSGSRVVEPSSGILKSSIKKTKGPRMPMKIAGQRLWGAPVPVADRKARWGVPAPADRVVEVISEEHVERLNEASLSTAPEEVTRAQENVIESLQNHEGLGEALHNLSTKGNLEDAGTMALAVYEILRTMKEINMRQEALIAEGREKRQQGLSDVELAELEAKREEITRLEKITDSANARAQQLDGIVQALGQKEGRTEVLLESIAKQVNSPQKSTMVMDPSITEATKRLLGHVKDFRGQLSVEVQRMFSEVGRLRDEKKELQSSIAELLAFQARQNGGAKSRAPKVTVPIPPTSAGGGSGFTGPRLPKSL